MGQKILVTGGAGYIGSHIVNLLGKANHDLVVVDNLSTGRKESILFGRHENFNLEDTDQLEALFKKEKFDACFHLASSIVVHESIVEPIKYYENNTNNSLELIRLCEKYEVNKFVFSSTAAVYGMGDGGKCSEKTPTNPINPYGRSKLMTEWMLEDIANATELNFVALRYFNVSGANMEGLIGECTPNATHLIKIASECAAGKRERMFIFGDDYNTPDGTCVRDYIHIDDLAQAHVDALKFLNEKSESIVLNCGYGHGYSVKEVLDTVKNVTGVDFDVEIAPRRDGDPPELLSITEKIKTTLGWVPRYDNLETIVRTAYQWEEKLK